VSGLGISGRVRRGVPFPTLLFPASGGEYGGGINEADTQISKPVEFGPAIG